MRGMAEPAKGMKKGPARFQQSCKMPPLGHFTRLLEACRPLYSSLSPGRTQNPNLVDGHQLLNLIIIKDMKIDAFQTHNLARIVKGAAFETTVDTIPLL